MRKKQKFAPHIAPNTKAVNPKEGKEKVYVHAAFRYRCEKCGRVITMFCETGIEELDDGNKHKPTPFTILCPFCGGFMSDASGISRSPYGPMPLPAGASYFANKPDKDCGQPVFSEHIKREKSSDGDDNG